VTVIVVPRAYRPLYSPDYYGPFGFYSQPTVISSGPTLAQFGSATFTPPPSRSLNVAPNALQQLWVPPGFAAFQAPGLPAVPGAAPADIDRALQLLASPREQDRIDGSIALGRSRAPKAIDPLQLVLATDPSARVREAVARGLGLLGSPSSLKALQTAAQGDEDRDVRHSAQFAAEAIRSAKP
jgi:hypothetical protein